MAKKEKNGKPGRGAKQPRPASATDPAEAQAKALMFDIDSAELPDWIENGAMQSGGYPYAEKLKRADYEDALLPLQIELLKLQVHVQKTGARVVMLFEGRDAAGKGGSIAAIMAHLNPRHARSVALTKPTEAERGQWYFQRYIAHLPTRGDMVLFDRSWYNRAGVERVMGFCDNEQLADFLREAPELEGMLVRDGIHLFKFYLTIGREAQLKRFHERRHDPLKQWKLTDIDLAAMTKWDDYSKAQHDLFRFTHTATSPWTVIRANDQRRARLEAIRVILSTLDYEGKDPRIVAAPDPRIVGSGPEYFYGQ
ncbi:MAG: polyphosphate kinase 2 [Hyphomicrobium sp.]|nr:MAG: polyphosphate kinase 2 [Hyphomicrobium sp.]